MKQIKRNRISNLVPETAAIVAAARRVTEGNPRSDDVYVTVRKNLSIEYYILTNLDLAKTKGIDLVQHYLGYGEKEGRRPEPNFDPRSYLKAYKGHIPADMSPYYHYLTIGKKLGFSPFPYENFEEYADLRGVQPSALRDALIRERQDVFDRLLGGELGLMIKKASEIDPLISRTWKAVSNIAMPPFHSKESFRHLLSLKRAHAQLGRIRATAAVLIPHCRMSGATKIASYLTRSLAELHGPENVVVLQTDGVMSEYAEWFPKNVRHLDFCQISEGLNNEQKQQALLEILRSLGVEHTFNVNSSIGWEMLLNFGLPLSQEMRLYTYFFCDDRDAYGNVVGYPVEKFYRVFDYISAFLCDSRFLQDQLAERFLLPEKQRRKLRCLLTPVDEGISAQDPVLYTATAKPVVYWAGRFDRQKRVDLLTRIAAKCPDIDFRIWGAEVIGDDNTHVGLAELPNVSLEPPFKELDEIPLEECAAWLYTSAWDGIPNMLIEIAALGVPIVGSIAGGTGEIIDDELSYPVHDIEDVDTYVNELRKVIADPQAARVKATKLLQRVRATHNADVYTQEVADAQRVE